MVQMMPIEFPKPKRLTSAGYAPIQEDVSLSPPAPVPVPILAPTPVAEFECRIKVHARKSDLSPLKLGVFSLGKSDNEKSINRWRNEEAIDSVGLPHTVFSGECFTEEPVGRQYSLSIPIKSDHLQ